MNATAVSWTFGKWCLFALAVVALLGTSAEVAGQGLDSFPAQQQPHSLAKRMDLEMCLGECFFLLLVRVVD